VKAPETPLVSMPSADELAPGPTVTDADSIGQQLAVFGFEAGILARARSRWHEDVLALVQAVATQISGQRGSVREDELDAWCRLHGLPCPALKHLFDRSRLGEWRYLRGGVWRFEPRPPLCPVDWRRNWQSAPRQLPEPSEFFKPNQRALRYPNEERTANQRAALRGKGRYHDTTIPRGEE
jgi:hypothetical protein